MSQVICTTCPHSCRLKDGEKGICGTRQAKDNMVVSTNYGIVTALALDPIEKKPLNRFHPNSKILSVGSFGCNLSCPFCQNHTITRCNAIPSSSCYILPNELVDYAHKLVDKGNIGIAYTYNEPLIGWEYVLDCARLAKEKGLVNVLVSNGYINPNPLNKLLPFIDAANIDLKSFNKDFYAKMGGKLEPVKRTIATLSERCHLEVTTLVIPKENDNVEEMQELSRWLSLLRKDIPLHITRFFPNYLYDNKSPTPISTIRKLAKIARSNLDYVYCGNC